MKHKPSVIYTTGEFQPDSNRKTEFIHLIGGKLTCVTPHVDLQTTGLVVNLPAVRVCACVVATFPEVGPIVGEQGTKGDEGFFTACRTQNKKESAVSHQSLF